MSKTPKVTVKSPTEFTVDYDTPAPPPPTPVYAETPDELEARIAKLESRLDWLYRWTLSDRNGHKYYSPAFTERAKDDRFPLPDYDAPGGPRKPQREP